MMSTDQRDSDAERLEILRTVHRKCDDPMCQICVALRVIDARDAALREKDAEIARWRAAEQSLSRAYVRLRSLIPGAFDSPIGPSAEQVWKTTEKALAAMGAELARLRSAARVVDAARDAITGSYDPVTSPNVTEIRRDRAMELLRKLAEHDAASGDGSAMEPDIASERENAFDSGKDEGAASERAKIVALLQMEAEDDADPSAGRLLRAMIEAIERGDHASGEGRDG